MTTWGPVHFVLRATTSASIERSAKAMFRCDFSWRHASLHGMVSEKSSSDCCTRDDEGAGVNMIVPGEPGAVGGGETDRPAAVMFPRLGHVAHGDDEHIESPRAVQKALPNGSSAQAMQFDGSPEHTGSANIFRAGSGEGRRIWKIGVMRGLEGPLRRRGTAGWYAGRLSRMETGTGAGDEES